MEESSHLAKIRYQCRRGMLELDVFLPQYFESQYSSMKASKKRLFEQLLEEPDPDLFAWLMGFDDCKPPYKELVTEIRQFQLQRQL